MPWFLAVAANLLWSSFSHIC